MIKIIKSIDPYHQNYVKLAVDRIQDEGYEVTKVERVQKCWIFFGEDVTHIHYRALPEKTNSRVTIPLETLERGG